MADFSPTGLWAHYSEGGEMWDTPVVAFEKGSDGVAHAMVCHDEGYLVRASAATFLGSFWVVAAYRVGE